MGFKTLKSGCEVGHDGFNQVLRWVTSNPSLGSKETHGVGLANIDSFLS
jgi:hypothetical protein